MDTAHPGVAYFNAQRPRFLGAPKVLRALADELLGHIGTDQLRALFHAAGARMAEEHPLGKVERLGELEAAARELLAANDWGWLRIEQRDDAVDFVHGLAPLNAWFGEGGLEWSSSLFEGLYGTWLRQLGADDRLSLRQLQTPAADAELRFRLTHESRFPL